MSHPFDSINHVRLSNSSTASLNSCNRRFEFRKLYGHPISDESIAAACGQCLHSAYQDFLVHGNFDRATYVMLETYPYHLNVLDNDNYSLYACNAALESMISCEGLLEYELATIKTPDGIERPAIEVPFEFRIKNFSLSDNRLVTVSYVGKTDCILFRRSDNGYIVSDIKTHRRNLMDMTAIYTHDEQLTPYGLVLERLLGNEMQTFEVRYISTYLDLMNANTKLYTFMRTKQDVNDWAQGLVKDLYNLKNGFQTGWFRRNHHSCVAFNKVCNYMDICDVREPSIIYDMVEAMKNEHTPYEDKFGTPWITMDLDLGFAEAA